MLSMRGKVGRVLMNDFQVFLPSATILERIFGTKWRNPVKLDRKRKVWYLFLLVF